jgi:PAS domain S-box-containing protein
MGGELRDRVLVVDDNADMRSYLKRLLSSSYQVLLAADGNTAFALARGVRPDLIIADVMMPEMDGVTLLKALRANTSTASILVLLLSARAGEEATVEGLRAGANDYLVKPFSPRELLARVQLWLEIARLRTEAELARQHLHDLLMQAPALICVLRGEAHVYELVNPLYQQLFGNRALLGKSIREALPELEGQGFYELLDRVYRSGEAFVGTEVRVELDRDNTGHLEEAYFNFVYQPIRGSRDEVEGIMVHAVEVTEQVRARQRMQTFLGIASHELKNPLTSISGNLQIARRRVQALVREQEDTENQWARSLEAVKALLERAERQVAFENRLVSDLIDTSRIQAGKLELRITSADLNELVREAVEEQRQVAPTRTIHLQEAEVSPLLVLADADRVRQVVTNYLSNALKYSGAEQAVAVEVEAMDTEVRVAVRDRGVGLSEEEQARVWESFYRAPGVQVQSGSGTGLGLGLYICQTIIGEHGGRVGVESAKGQGSTFWLTLPRRP